MKRNVSTVLKVVAAAAAAWAVWRVWQARRMGVALDVAFKYPTTSIGTLRVGGRPPGGIAAALKASAGPVHR